MDRQRIPPATVALAWRLLGTALLCAVWIEDPRDEAGLILILILSTMGLVRWRFAPPAWTTLLDQAACAVVGAFFWQDAAFAFALPVFDACLLARPTFALPALAALFLLGAWSVPVAAALCAAALAGFAVHLWSHQLLGARQQADRDRKERFELESLRAELQTANVRVARMAGLAERARIARDLHDHAGHEITAARLALAAFRRLWQEGDEQSGELLDQAERRVGDAMDLLRNTVRGMSPDVAVGAGALQEICRRFTACEVTYSVHGDTAVVPVHAWGVLEPCLKEALTNAARHEGARKVDVALDVGPHIVRLCVHNPMRGLAAGGRGIGLDNLSQRARAVGGSIATDTRDGFRLICVLPLAEEQR